jgi:hypothetical protein
VMESAGGPLRYWPLHRLSVTVSLGIALHAKYMQSVVRLLKFVFVYLCSSHADAGTSHDRQSSLVAFFDRHR